MHPSHAKLHSEWVKWLLKRDAVTGPMAGEPINMQRIAERIGYTPEAVLRWRNAERTDLRLPHWSALMQLVMEEIHGTAWTRDQQRAIYWGGPKFYEAVWAGRDTLLQRVKRTTKRRGKA